MRLLQALLSAVLVAAVAVASPLAAASEPYPSRAIQLIVPYTPGGNTDLLGRIIAQKLGESWNQSVVVENRPGAGGTTGVTQVVRAKPDGHTMVLAAFGNILVAQSLYKNLPYDPATDLIPVVLLATPPTIVTVTPSLPVKDIKGLIAYAKANPGKLNYGSSGAGTSNHLFGELFASMADVRMTHVPYKGSGPAITDLMAGTIQLNFAPLPLVRQQIKAGSLRALAVTGSQRSPALPDVPTVAEAGLPGYEGNGWFALMVPKGTPKDVVTKLNAEVNRILKSPDVRSALETEGADPIGGTTADAARSMEQGIGKWRGVVSKLELKLE
ncbi:Bug family tripartite tricarboxylate transporter substrate binding protein [Hydrogenophaga sp. BPS33]|uniref:Bug family tripartite tricarboxylate transporter substrate binding protein n=1 Tax=Hydrogenophaga sp. BPS33 TaxID=2651974 RepID=UPI00131F9582|nr:tripartite tricarboxylate transporter substrate binding protein [Hydrogenophaga sp. BPS33]QHE88183.1 tripartite tricarboxylate transporter substrate binding protein [Hydrogenophaga sp. BPS33]